MRKTVIPLDLWKKIIDWLEENYDSADIIDEGKTYMDEEYIYLDPSIDDIYEKVVKKFGIKNAGAKKELRNYFDYMNDMSEDDMNTRFYDDGDDSMGLLWEYYWEKWIKGDS